MNTARRARLAAFFPLALLASHAFGASGEGLTADAERAGWPRWQGRISVAVPVPAWRTDLAGIDAPGLRAGSARLLGDYYLTRRDWGAGTAAGFRATSGLLVGSRAVAWTPAQVQGLAGSGLSVERRTLSGTAPEAGTVPYVGLGWSGASARGGWSVSADLGVMSLNPGGAVQLGRAVNGLANVEDALREMRLSPVLQLGVSYSF